MKPPTLEQYSKDCAETERYYGYNVINPGGFGPCLDFSFATQERLVELASKSDLFEKAPPGVLVRPLTLSLWKSVFATYASTGHQVGFIAVYTNRYTAEMQDSESSSLRPAETMGVLANEYRGLGLGKVSRRWALEYFLKNVLPEKWEGLLMEETIGATEPGEVVAVKNILESTSMGEVVQGGRVYKNVILRSDHSDTGGKEMGFQDHLLPVQFITLHEMGLVCEGNTLIQNNIVIGNITENGQLQLNPENCSPELYWQLLYHIRDNKREARRRK